MTETNPNSRLEAFCDGVFAIAITLLVIDIKLPSSVEVMNTHDFWLALNHTLPSIFGFILSFVVILITWANHHAFIKMVNKASPQFNYANGFLLMTVAFIPFPTSLVGEYILTDHAAPAMIVYNAVLALVGFAWLLITWTALKYGLLKDEKTTKQVITMRLNGFFAFLFYLLLAVLAIWFPMVSAIITTITWVFWLIFGINLKHE